MRRSRGMHPRSMAAASHNRLLGSHRMMELYLLQVIKTDTTTTQAKETAQAMVLLATQLGEHLKERVDPQHYGS